MFLKQLVCMSVHLIDTTHVHYSYNQIILLHEIRTHTLTPSPTI